MTELGTTPKKICRPRTVKPGGKRGELITAPFDMVFASPSIIDIIPTVLTNEGTPIYIILKEFTKPINNPVKTTINHVGTSGTFKRSNAMLIIEHIVAFAAKEISYSPTIRTAVNPNASIPVIATLLIRLRIFLIVRKLEETKEKMMKRINVVITTPYFIIIVCARRWFFIADKLVSFILQPLSFDLDMSFH
jgi:hypothetical protein